MYSSALVFTPISSIVRKQFSDRIPDYLYWHPAVGESWSSLLQTLEGYSTVVRTVVFLPDGKLLASGIGGQDGQAVGRRLGRGAADDRG